MSLLLLLEPLAYPAAGHAVDGENWNRNSIASSGAGEVVLLNNTTTDNASLIATGRVPSIINKSLTANLWVQGAADQMQLGYVDAAISKTTTNEFGILVPSFFGADIDVFNGRINFYFGAAGGLRAQVTVAGLADTAYRAWRVDVSTEGANTRIRAYRDNVLMASHAAAFAPSTPMSPAIGARSGGVAGTFKASGSPTFTDAPIYATGSLSFSGSNSFITTQPLTAATLSDDFSTQNTVKWGGWDAEVVASGGTLNLTPTVGETTQSVYSAQDYTLVGSTAMAKLVQPPPTWAANVYAALSLEQWDGSIYRVGYAYDGTNVVLRMQRRHGSGSITTTEVVRDPTVYPWLRVRVGADATVYWESSADAVTWTTHLTEVTPNATSLSFVLFLFQASGTAGPSQTVKFDNFNLIPVLATGSLSFGGASGASGQASASGSLSLSGTGLAVHAPAMATGSLSLSGAGAGRGVAAATGSLVLGSRSGIPTFSDNFDRADAATLGSNWVQSPIKLAVASNQVSALTGAAAARWVAPTFSDDQFVEATYRGGTLLGIALAMQEFAAEAAITNGVGSCYVFYQSSAAGGIAIAQKGDNTTAVTDLVAAFGSQHSLVVGDVIRLTYIAGVLTAYRNGTEVLTHTPSTPLTGRRYVGLYNNRTSAANGAIFDDFSGGNPHVEAAASPTATGSLSFGASAGTTHAASGSITLTGIHAPKAGTLQDDFSTKDTNKWTYSPGAGVVAGELDLGITGGETFSNIRSGIYDLSESSVTVRLTVPPPSWPISFNLVTGLQIKRFDTDVIIASAEYFRNSAGTHMMDGSVYGQYSNEQAFDLASPPWIRVRETGGTLYVERSPDRVTWTLLRSELVASSLLVRVEVHAQDYSAGTPATQSVRYDNFNIAPAITGTGSLSLSGTSGASGQASATGSIDLFGIHAPKIETLTDDFTFKDLNKWSWPTGTGVTNGELALDINGTNPYPEIETVGNYDLSGSSFTAQLTQSPATFGSSSLILVGIRWVAPLNIYLEWAQDGIGTYARGIVVGTNGRLYRDPAVFKWMRIRETAGTVYAEISVDRSVWEVVHSGPSTTSLSRVGYPRIYAGSDEATTTVQTVKFDNFNVAPAIGAGSLSLGGSSGAAGRASASGSLSMSGTAGASGQDSATGSIELLGLNTPKAGLLVDNFSFKDLNKWTWVGSADVAGGQLDFPLSLATPSARITSNWYDLTESSATVQITQFPPSWPLNNLYVELSVRCFSEEFGETTFSSTVFSRDEFGAYHRESSFGADGTFDPTVPLWVRAREAGGTFYWESSPDRVTWAVLASNAYTLDLRRVRFRIDAVDYSETPTAQSARFDNFNLVPATATGSLSFGGTSEASGRASGSGSLSLSGSNSFITTQPLTPATLFDDFSVQNTKWEYFGTAVSGGTLNVDLGVFAGNRYAGTNQNYTLSGSSVTAQLAQPPSTWDVGTSASIQFIFADDSGYVLRYRYDGINVVLVAQNYPMTGAPAETIEIRDPLAFPWLRIRESAGTVYWETSADAVTWSVVRSEVQSQNSVAFAYLVARSSDSVIQTVKWDNFNTTPAVATGSLSFGGTGGASGQASASGSVLLSGDAVAGSGPVAASASGSLTFSGTAATRATSDWSGTVSAVTAAAASATGSLTLSGIAALAEVAVATGSLSLSGTSGASGQASASGSLTLVGTGSAAATNSATGSLTLSGTSAALAATTATGSLSISGTASASGRGSASGSLDVSGASAARAAAVTTGSLELSGTAAARAATAATGSLTLSGTSAAQVATTSTGSLTLAGSAVGQAVGGASGSLSLSGAATARAVTTTTGSLSFAGTSTAGVLAATSGALTLAGSASSTSPALASGSIALSGSTNANAQTGATGSLTLSAVAVAADATLAASATGSIALSGTADGVSPALASGSLSLSSAAIGQVSVSSAGSLTLAGVGSSESPAGAAGTLAVVGSAGVAASLTSTGSLDLSGSAVASSLAAPAGSLSLAGAALTASPASATGSLSLSGAAQSAAMLTPTGSLSLSGVAQARAATSSTGVLSLAGSVVAVARTTATGALSISGSGNAGNSRSATGSLTLTGAATAAVRLVATGSLALSATASPAARATAAGSLILTSTASASALPASTGSIALSGSSTARAATTTTGSLSLTATAAMRAVLSASGSLALSGLSAASVSVDSAGSLALYGTANAGNARSGTGSIALAGAVAASPGVTAIGTLLLAGTSAGVGVAAAVGSLTLTSTAGATTQGSTSGSIVLNGTGGIAGQTAAEGSGSLSMSGSGQGAARSASTGNLTLVGAGGAQVTFGAIGLLNLTAAADAAATQALLGSIQIAGTAGASPGGGASGHVDLTGFQQIIVSGAKNPKAVLVMLQSKAVLNQKESSATITMRQARAGLVMHRGTGGL